MHKLGILTYICAIIHFKTYIMNKSTFYHAGCPVCVAAEQEIIELIGAEKVNIIHLGDSKDQIEPAEQAGVQSVPALVTPNGNVLHINFGAALADLKA